MKTELTIKLTKDRAYEWLLFCLISRTALQSVITKGLRIVHLSSIVGVLLAIAMLAPIAIITIKKTSKAYEVFTFVGIYIFFWGVVLIVGTVHPQYEEYYARPVFGMYEVFFGFERGAIFGLLAFSGIHDGKKVLKCFHSGAGLLFFYSLFEWYRAKTIGYWETYDAAGNLAQYNYSLTYGYQVMFCCIIFTFFFLENRKWYDLMATILGFILVILDGSRGSLICLAVFLILYLLVRGREMSKRKRLFFIALISVSYLILTLFWDFLFTWLINRLTEINIDSRTIAMLLSGNMSSDSARSTIYDMCWKNISKQGFFGMGPFGNRTFITSKYYWGYPHNIILELILDYGWMIAVIIMISMVLAIIEMFRKVQKDELMIFCILLSYNIKLFLSSTYWAEPFFWGMLAWMAVALKPYIFRKRKNSKISALSRW